MPTGPANRLLPALRRVVLVRQTADRSDGELLSAFVATADPDAFAALVRRHGPMVLGVCRRVVGDAGAAEDAFQAVFLVLARRAAAVRPRGQVGNWLYGVAYRTAIKARSVLARRRSREKQVDVMPDPPARPTTDPWTDLQPVIDEELARLPDKLRLPVVLCDLEGRPQRAVAKHLGVAPATLAARLVSARRLLAGRLSRRGVALSGGALAGLLGDRAAAAVVTPRLADAAVQAAEAVSAGAAVSGLVSAHAVQLSEGVMRMMLLAKLKAVGAAALAVLAVTGGLGFGLVPAQAADGPAVAAPGGSGTTAPKDPPAAPPVDDATFLRRLCLDLRGTPPTALELLYFLADPDPNKRAKVVDWVAADDTVRLFLGKKLNVAADRVRVLVRAGGPDGKPARVLIVVVPAKVTLARVNALAFSPDGKKLAAELLPLNLDVQEAATGTFLFGVSPNSDAGLTGSVASNTALVDQLVVRGWAAAADPPATVWEVQPGDSVRLYNWVADPVSPFEYAQVVNRYFLTTVAGPDTDEAFLRRVVEAARGTPPTAVELQYFAEDKDPKKREKLLDTLLKDPAVAKKLGDDWKKKMLEPPGTAVQSFNTYLVRPDARRWVWDQPYSLVFPPQPNTAQPAPPQPDRLEKLVGELLAANKTDEQVLEAVTLATVSRLPTDAEKRLTLAAVSKAADRKGAWVEAARALAGSDEAKRNAPAGPPAKP